ncbi:MAG: aminoacyl-tRNA hydrolase [Planctomycetaceae bacterium]|nr:aminoacyl-tRNA hydrolase [Planctomycetaceae bacterium]
MTSSIRVPLSELEFNYARSSGPGGQNVNKVNSKVQLRWNLAATQVLPFEVAVRFRTQNRGKITDDGVFILVGQQFRDQPRNKADVIDRLRILLLAATKAPKTRRPTRATKGSKLRRLASKKRNSTRKSSRRSPGMDD